MKEGRRGRGLAFRVRVTVLLSLLVLVLLWAASDMKKRKARTKWDHTLTVAIVLLYREPSTAALAQSLRERTGALEDRLAEEFRRYGAADRAGTVPFKFIVEGPAPVPLPVPSPPANGGLLDLLAYNYKLWRFARRANANAGVDARGVDSTIYLVAKAPESEERSFVEGASQEGGTLGLVEVELAPSMLDFALFVTTHELFHTLGATDKYDDDGKALVPSGLVEPERTPRYPQTLAEIMARGIPVAAGVERPPDSLDELGIGWKTATEIGWADATRSVASGNLGARGAPRQ